MADRTHITPQSALARIVEAFLMIEAPADLLDYLSAYGADAEDLEDDDPDQEDDPGEDDARRYPVDTRRPWPPSRDELAAAFAAGRTQRDIAGEYGRSPASVSMLASRYGLKPARALGTLRPQGHTSPAMRDGSLRWPPTAEQVRSLRDAGIGDARAAALFGVHHSTYRARRRALVGTSVVDPDAEAPNSADYGYVRGARWPRWRSSATARRRGLPDVQDGSMGRPPPSCRRPPRSRSDR